MELRETLPSRARVPPFAANEIAVAVPCHAILASGSVGVGDCSSAIGPKGVVVAVAGAGGAWGPATLAEVQGERRGLRRGWRGQLGVK